MIESFNRKFNPALTIISFCIPFIFIECFNFFLVFLALFYYGHLGIPVLAYQAALILPRLVVPLTQPLIGYFSDRNYRITRKLGRRFPWIIVSGVFLPIPFLLIFLPDVLNISRLGIFLIITLIFFNIFSSLYITSYFALLFNKFRYPKERLIVVSIVEFLSTISYAFLLPFLHWVIFSVFDFRFTSGILVWQIIIVTMFVISILLGIPGLLEEKELIATYFSHNQKPQEWFLKDFFKRFIIAFRHKNFLVLLLVWIATSILSVFFFSNISHYAFYVFDASNLLIDIMRYSYDILFIISIPIILVLSRFFGYLKIWIVSSFAMGAVILVFPFLGVSTIPILILMGSIGFFSGLTNISIFLLMGDVFDESASKHRKHSEGFFYGLLNLFGGFILFFYTVARMTPFGDYWFSSPSLIIILLSVLPGIAIILTTIIFVKVYDLKPEKVSMIKNLKEEI